MKKLYLYLTLYLMIISLAVCSQDMIETYLRYDSLLSVNNTEAAKECLVQLCKNNPYNQDYHYELGKIYYLQEDYRNSIDHLKKAQAYGLVYRSNYFLACNYVKLDQPDSAIYYLANHIISPMNGDFMINASLYDSIFLSLHDFPYYQDLLPPNISDSLNRDENWKNDIDYLSSLLKKTHYDPFCEISEAEWDSAIEQLKADVPFLGDNQILVRIHQFVALIGDGHTSVYSQRSNLREKVLPVLTQMFSDGCYIVGATEDYIDLLGAKITAINGQGFNKVFDKISSVISADNEMGYKSMFGWNLFRMSLVHGLGLSISTDSLEIAYIMNNETASRTLKTSLPEELSELIRYHAHYNKEYPLFLKNYHKGKRVRYWYEYFPEEDLIYVQINSISSLEEKPLPEFCDRLSALIETADVSAFILDLRNNSGGNTELNKHILKLMLSKKINLKGKSFTLIGCKTFSAAQNLTNILENYTETIFIGERTASRPNFIGETNSFILPYSRLMIGSSNVYHQHGYSADTRKWVAPDIKVDLNFKHFEKGIDPVLMEVKKYLKN